MNKIFYCIALLSMIILCSCGESTTSLVYPETKCADPWKDLADPSNETLKERVQAYLDDNMISYERINITEDGIAQDCEACSCTTARRIHAEAVDAAVDALKDLGFILE